MIAAVLDVCASLCGEGAGLRRVMVVHSRPHTHQRTPLKDGMEAQSSRWMPMLSAGAAVMTAVGFLFFNMIGDRVTASLSEESTDRLATPTPKWAWNGSDVVPESYAVLGTPIVIDLDGDKLPEVVFVSGPNDISRVGEGTLRAVSGRDGSEVFTVTNPALYLNAQNGLAGGDIDNDGRPEIIGRTSADTLIAFEHDGTYKWTSPDLACWGNKAHAAIADVDHDGTPEIAICATLLNNDGTIRWQHRPVSTGTETSIADIDLDGDMEVIDGWRVYLSDGTILWEHPEFRTVASAVANLDDDPEGEVIMIEEEKCYILEHDGTIKVGPVLLPLEVAVGLSSWGSPVIADVDGDGRPEIGIAGGGRYSMLEHDGTLKWSVPVGAFNFFRGAAAADLDGDGTAEIVFQGPEGLMIIRGTDGHMVWQYSTPERSATFAFNLPVIADVDADSHADIVSIWTSRSSAQPVPAMLVFGDKSWMPTRPIWNQHSYHVTNVNDDGTIPRYEEPNWKAHNNYRANERLAGPYPRLQQVFMPLTLSEQGRKALRAVDVVLAVDTSNSMVGTKIEAARSAIRLLLDEISWQHDHVALVSFSEAAKLCQPLTGDRDAVWTALSSIVLASGTRIDEGLRLARSELEGERGRGEAVARVVVVLTDGLQVSSPDLAVQESVKIQAMGARLIVVGLGTDVDRGFLERLAGLQGRAYFAPEPADLAEIYQSVGRVLSCQTEDYWGHRCG
ncbi:MAG: FG-GAP-like repeat-containing protein [Ardenticatenales bacterium]